MPVRVVDRGDWAAVNIDGLKQVITPLADQADARARSRAAWPR